MKVYVSGPMSGIEDYNYPAFHEAAAHYRRLGFDVVSPAELNTDTDGRWEDYLRTDLRALLTCDAIAMLAGWESSRGANLELHVARALAMEVWDGTVRASAPCLLAVADEAGAAERDRLRNEVVNLDRRMLDDDGDGYGGIAFVPLLAVMALLDEPTP